jgi:guanylate kinase
MNTTDTQKLKKIKVAIIGPSGVGKGTQIAKHMEFFPTGTFHLSVSCTTRKKRDTETDGKDYYFISEENFQKKIELGVFAEWSKHHDCYYGTLKSECDTTHHSVIFDVEVDGAIALKKIYPDLVTIFLQPPSIAELNSR